MEILWPPMHPHFDTSFAHGTLCITHNQFVSACRYDRIIGFLALCGIHSVASILLYALKTPLSSKQSASPLISIKVLHCARHIKYSAFPHSFVHDTSASYPLAIVDEESLKLRSRQSHLVMGSSHCIFRQQISRISNFVIIMRQLRNTKASKTQELLLRRNSLQIKHTPLNFMVFNL